MAVTLSNIKHISAGNSRRVVFDVTGPASYTNTGTYSTSGELLTLAQQRQVMNENAPAAVDFTKATLFHSELEQATTPRQLMLDKTNNRMHFLTNAGAEVANATDLHLVTIRAEIIYDIASG
jgi:hypothetical protein